RDPSPARAAARVSGGRRSLGRRRGRLRADAGPPVRAADRVAPRAGQRSGRRGRGRTDRRGSGAGVRVRDLIFSCLAVLLLVGYIVLGQRVAPLLLPSAAAT